MRGARWKLALGAAVAALFAGRWMAHHTADRLWAEALGVGTPHGDIALLQLALGVGASVIAAAWFLGNLVLLYRQIGAVQVPRQVGNLEIVEHVPRRYLLAGVIVVGGALGVLSGYGAGDLWAIRALSGSSMALGQADPVLGHDLAYYLFELPWLRALHGYTLWLTGLALVLIALLYAAIGAIRRVERSLAFMPFARWHLAALSGTLALTLAWGYALEPAELVAGLRGVPYDTILLDVRVPAAAVLAVLAIGTATASLVWMRVDRARIPAIAWLALLTVTFLAHFVVPAVIAGGRGAAGREDPELTAAATKAWREAFGAAADTVPVSLAIPDPQFGERHARDLTEAPIWDAFVLTPLLNRLAPPMRQDPRDAGSFFGAELTLLRRPGRPGATAFLAVREPDSLGMAGTPGRPPDAAVGMVAVRASRTASGGVPVFLPDLATPDSTLARPVDVTLTGVRTWFSPAMSGNALVPGALGLRGVQVGSLARRVALAWTLQMPSLLSRDRAPAGTLVVTERAVSARLARYAPFARFGAAWPAVLDGQLIWMAWGYVTAEGYPLGSPVVWRGQRVRALRAGFLGTVNAETGTVRVYLAETRDPVSRAWQRVLPDLVLAFDTFPPGLRSFLRYPQELFRAQLQLLRDREGRARPIDPDWWVGPSVGDSVVRLRLRAVDEVQPEPRVAAVIEGTMEGGTPRLRVLRYPEPYALPGPAEFERDFAGTVPGGSLGGRIRLLPFEDGAVAVQAFYTDSGTLAGIVAGWPGAIGVATTLTEALRRVAPRVPGARATPPARSYEAAREWFLRLDRARAGADWEAFGEAWAGLRAALGLGEDPAPVRVAPPIPRD